MNQKIKRGRAKAAEEHAKQLHDLQAVTAKETLRTSDFDWLIPPR